MQSKTRTVIKIQTATLYLLFDIQTQKKIRAPLYINI